MANPMDNPEVVEQMKQLEGREVEMPSLESLAKEARERVGSDVLTQAQAPELFQNAPQGRSDGDLNRVIELLESLPRRIAEELGA